MRRFVIEECVNNLTSHSGLELVGSAINNHTHLTKQLDGGIALRHGLTPT